MKQKADYLISGEKDLLEYLNEEIVILSTSSYFRLTDNLYPLFIDYAY